jgi:hypothetical protein
MEGEVGRGKGGREREGETYIEKWRGIKRERRREGERDRG